jgi:S1-C subfamily serine protease
MKLLLRLILFLFSVCQVNAAGDSEWDRVRFHNLQAGQTYEISSGTGFFVNPNYIITNHHVVEGCKNIAVRGAVDAELVALVADDQNLDLAILYSSVSPDRVAYLRINDAEVHYGDKLFAVGYPLEHGKSGEYVIQPGTVIKVNTFQNDTSIEFTNSVDHGNSGGPLLDANANVVGVVKAKKTYFDSEDPNKVYNITGIAIGLDSLRRFLEGHGVIYSQNTSYDIFTNYNLDKITKEYVVNIHCVK